MPQIPQDKSPDATFSLAKYGNEFILKKCRRYESDIFQTRLMFHKAICMRGKEAAEKFYDTNLFKREGVAPNMVKATLFGSGGIQGLDGNAHRRRKQMFMSLMSSDGIQDLVDLTEKQWNNFAHKWEEMKNVVLLHEVQMLICRAVCEWTGISLKDDEVKQRTDDLAALIEGPVSLGMRHWKARQARKKSERWIAELVRKVRTGKKDTPEGNALHTVSTHTDLQNNLLDEQTAAVELINILRPTIAVSRFITFAALAIHNYPESKSKLRKGDKKDEYLTWFVQEVRRFYPFFPFVAAKVRKDFEWNDYQFKRGTLVLLDLYGTNRHPELWENPEIFQPERFRDRDDNPFNFIPQGGGSYDSNHRCPGEWITIALMKSGVYYLVNSIEYDVPEQDLSVDLSRIPALPKSRFVINNVRQR